MTYLETRPRESYFCIFCQKELTSFDGVFVHDGIPHPPDATFDEEERPQ